jgi:bifunctional DNA-binding transcriptional regulator/antitoxin component of YhaV-PrlF toxin-antitoxin module
VEILGQAEQFDPNYPMSAGRPPTWNPFRDISPSSWTELAAIKDRGRLTIPAEVRRRVTWLSPLPDSVLASISLDGSVELLPWEGSGEGVIDGHRERLQALDEYSRGKLAIVLADKFFRLAVEEPARLTVPAGLRSFLETHAGQPVRFVVSHQQLWLWNERLWQSGRSDREALIT